MRIGAIIQARMGSSRLPGKVLRHLPHGSNETVLHQVVNRISSVSKVDQVVIATTTRQEDDPIVGVAKEIGVPYFRGSEQNVLERFYLAAKENDLDYVIRITSDCPVLDPSIVERLIDHHLTEQIDFSSLSLKRTFPVGQDAAFFSFALLEEAYTNAQYDYEREHVTTYFYKTHPEKFKIHVMPAPPQWAAPNLRLTVDTSKDYIFLCCLFDELYENNPLFGLDDIFELLERKAYLKDINSSVTQKRVAHGLAEQVAAALPIVREQGYEDLAKFLVSIKLD